MLSLRMQRLINAACSESSISSKPKLEGAVAGLEFLILELEGELATALSLWDMAHNERSEAMSRLAELEARLALPDAEPIGYMRPDELRKAASQPYLCRVHPAKDKHADMVPVYATPQPVIALEPVKLTRSEVQSIVVNVCDQIYPQDETAYSETDSVFYGAFADAITAAIHAKQGGKPCSRTNATKEQEC